MRLICFDCGKGINTHDHYLEVKVLEWHQNRGNQIKGYVYHAEHFPPVGGKLTIEVS